MAKPPLNGVAETEYTKSQQGGRRESSLLTFGALLVTQKRDKRKVTLCFFAGENFIEERFHHMHPKPTKKRKPRHPAASAFFGGIY